MAADGRAAFVAFDTTCDLYAPQDDSRRKRGAWYIRYMFHYGLFPTLSCFALMSPKHFNYTCLDEASDTDTGSLVCAFKSQLIVSPALRSHGTSHDPHAPVECAQSPECLGPIPIGRNSIADGSRNTMQLQAPVAYSQSTRQEYSHRSDVSLLAQDKSVLEGETPQPRSALSLPLEEAPITTTWGRQHHDHDHFATSSSNTSTKTTNFDIEAETGGMVPIEEYLAQQETIMNLRNEVSSLEQEVTTLRQLVQQLQHQQIKKESRDLTDTCVFESTERTNHEGDVNNDEEESYEDDYEDDNDVLSPSASVEGLGSSSPAEHACDQKDETVLGSYSTPDDERSANSTPRFDMTMLMEVPSLLDISQIYTLGDYSPSLFC